MNAIDLIITISLAFQLLAAIMIYRMQEPKTVFLIFSTGRIVCTGAKTKEIVGEAVEKLVEEIKRLDLAQRKGDFDTGNDEEFI